MKHLLTICLLAAISLTATAQDHQTFKGVPIDGKSSALANQLKQKGFQQIGKSDTLIGTFAGYNDCEVTLLTSAQTDNVYGVKVKIPMCQEQNLLMYAEYKKLQAALTEKYGAPLNPQVERTQSTKEDDFITAFYKLIANVKETLDFPYGCVFDTGRGNVLLNGAWIASDCGGGFLIMTYIDNVNNNLHQQNIYDDL